MENGKLDRTTSRTISLPETLWDEIDKIAKERFGGNRSMTVERYFIDGLESKRSEPPSRTD